MIDLAPVESTVKPLLWPCRIGGMLAATVEFQVVIVFVDYGGSRIVVFMGVVLVVVLF